MSVATGASVTVTPTVITSDGRTLTGAAHEDVTYTSLDTAVAAVVAGADTLAVTGVASGSTTIRATRTDETVVTIPDSGITNRDLTVTVT